MSLNPALPDLLHEIRACTLCAEQLPLGPRPIVQASATARVLIIGQAPGTAVHASGVPWDDPSGDRLREWTGIDRDAFYDPARIALMPMGFCYPGKVAGAGDAPPRPECAPTWHARLRAEVPAIRLTLLVGQYAQAAYARAKAESLTDRVQQQRDAGEGIVSLPHPSWRSTGWMRRNPWFEADILPMLCARVADALA
ncbi:MAG: uracil-DNA glycosylase family protein [Sphingomonas sp.]|nr:uracil-DNA glycosylase family protein [Sphingomonas sp.]